MLITVDNNLQIDTAHVAQIDSSAKKPRVQMASGVWVAVKDQATLQKIIAAKKG